MDVKSVTRLCGSLVQGRYMLPVMSAMLENHLAEQAEERRHQETIAQLDEIKSLLAKSQAANETRRAKRARGTSAAGKKKGMMGPKTSRMAKQLRQFREYLKTRFDGDLKKLYGHAASFVRINAEAWEKARRATGDAHGYSSSKVLADAYRNAL